MLHELAHNVHGPHDAKFHALWDQLRDEHEALAMKGYTGEGFMSEGHRLGGRGVVPMHEARRLARAAAEKRRALGAGSGQRLGGRALRPGEDIRRVIVRAVERRNRTLQGCGNNTHNEEQIQAIAEAATRNGFRTQAEEDAANEAAIAQALWELVQEDEKARYGDSYRPVTASSPAGSGREAESHETQSVGDVSQRLFASAPHVTPLLDRQSGSFPDSSPLSWTCEICTLQNPPKYLCCDACGMERIEKETPELTQKSVKRQRTETVDLAKSRDEDAHQTISSVEGSNIKLSRAGQTGQPFAPQKKTWACSFCGRLRDWNFWSCDLCGKIKESS
jgi:DNA-dependent metalloprotease WSS1